MPSYNIVSRPAIDLVFNNVYSTPQRWQFETTLREVHPHSLALLFVILALGTLLNLEVPPNDPSAEEFYLLAQSCLAKGDFLRVNTIASVQALVSWREEGGRELQPGREATDSPHILHAAYHGSVYPVSELVSWMA